MERIQERYPHISFCTRKMMTPEKWGVRGDKLFEGDENGKQMGEANEFLSPSGALVLFNHEKYRHDLMKIPYHSSPTSADEISAIL